MTLCLFVYVSFQWVANHFKFLLFRRQWLLLKDRFLNAYNIFQIVPNPSTHLFFTHPQAFIDPFSTLAGSPDWCFINILTYEMHFHVPHSYTLTPQKNPQSRGLKQGTAVKFIYFFPCTSSFWSILLFLKIIKKMSCTEPEMSTSVAHTCTKLYRFIPVLWKYYEDFCLSHLPGLHKCI